MMTTTMIDYSLTRTVRRNQRPGHIGLTLCDDKTLAGIELEARLTTHVDVRFIERIRCVQVCVAHNQRRADNTCKYIDGILATVAKSCSKNNV